MSSQPDEVAQRLGHLAATDRFSLAPLYGGASDRWYFRLTGPLAERYHQPSLILMGVAPELNEMFDSYLRVRRCLARSGVPVPALFEAWTDEGILLLEDFGDLTMTGAVSASPERGAALYDEAIQLLVRVHDCADDPRDHCRAFDLHFDVEKFRYEFDFHVRRWVIGHWCSATPTRAEDAILSRTFHWISTTLAAEPRVFTHRDFQTSNLMVRDHAPHGRPRLGLTDFQDARQGLRQYDLASLLYDSYVDLTPAERERMTEAYCRLAGIPLTEGFRELLTVAAIQRKLHDAGAFVYTAAHRGKRDYLDYVPRTLCLATNLMAAVPQCREAAEVFGDYLARRNER